MEGGTNLERRRRRGGEEENPAGLTTLQSTCAWAIEVMGNSPETDSPLHRREGGTSVGQVNTVTQTAGTWSYVSLRDVFNSLPARVQDGACCG